MHMNHVKVKLPSGYEQFSLARIKSRKAKKTIRRFASQSTTTNLQSSGGKQERRNSKGTAKCKQTTSNHPLFHLSVKSNATSNAFRDKGKD
jgi:hypothetical protein